uniref:Uncharacterized protein n=1 Tax=Trypanosoma congolense (strain IL3000) TaxID=1068625 RepID=G0V0A6_TRYCI|nr:conserved hypothetical protein [Trypanosoma congolense IL3000]
MPHQGNFSLVCLGTGKGVSMVYSGNCSAAYVLCAGDTPIILFGAGYGVTRQCLRYFGTIPGNIVIFSNRSHVAAELPVVIGVESHNRRRLRVIASEAVMTQLKERRLVEVHPRAISTTSEVSDACELIALKAAEPGTPSPPHHLVDFPSISLSAFNALSTWSGASGFVVLHNNTPLVALTGDCAFDAQRYRAIVRMAPVVVVDGRKGGSLDHASFADITRTVNECQSRGEAPQMVLVGHYGEPAGAPPVVPGNIVLPIVEGAVVELSTKVRITDGKNKFNCHSAVPLHVADVPALQHVEGGPLVSNPNSFDLPFGPGAPDQHESTDLVKQITMNEDFTGRNADVSQGGTGGANQAPLMISGEGERQCNAAHELSGVSGDNTSVSAGAQRCERRVLSPESRESLRGTGGVVTFEECVQRAQRALQRFSEQGRIMSSTADSSAVISGGNASDSRTFDGKLIGKASSIEIIDTTQCGTSRSSGVWYTCRFTVLTT